MEHYIENKVIVVTGGSSGFGLATARLLLEMGAKVVITGRDEGRLEKAALSLAGGENLLALRADACVTADWKHLVKTVLDAFGPIDVLVNNHGAGIKIATLDEMDDETIQKVMDVNLLSIMKGTREVLPVMRAAGKGHVINVSSVCSHHAWAGWSIYSAAKAGMIGFTRCLHMEMAGWGGKATTFIPAAAETGFQSAANLNFGEQGQFPNATDFARSLVHCIDVPANSFIEEMTIWGTGQVAGFVNF